MTSPAQTSSTARRGLRRGIRRPRARSREEERAAPLEERADLRGELSFDRLRRRREEGLVLGEEERDPSVARAERLDAGPRDLARTRRARRDPRDGIRRRAPARIRASSTDAGSGHPWSCATVSRSASRPAPPARDALPLEQEPAEAAASTGSISRRSFASDLRRTARSTSASQHSRPLPPRRNAPSTTLPGGDETLDDLLDRVGVRRRSARRARPTRTVRACGPSARRDRPGILHGLEERVRQPRAAATVPSASR